jgi:hypothetical protein
MKALEWIEIGRKGPLAPLPGRHCGRVASEPRPGGPWLTPLGRWCGGHPRWPLGHQPGRRSTWAWLPNGLADGSTLASTELGGGPGCRGTRPYSSRSPALADLNLLWWLAEEQSPRGARLGIMPARRSGTAWPRPRPVLPMVAPLPAARRKVLRCPYSLRIRLSPLIRSGPANPRRTGGNDMSATPKQESAK